MFYILETWLPGNLLVAKTYQTVYFKSTFIIGIYLSELFYCSKKWLEYHSTKKKFNTYFQHTVALHHLNHS